MSQTERSISGNSSGMEGSDITLAGVGAGVLSVITTWRSGVLIPGSITVVITHL